MTTDLAPFLPLPAVTLILGGARSGKSTLAERLAKADLARGERLVYVATAEGLDAEMAARIEQHRRDRGDVFETIEVPLALADALAGIAGPAVVVVDCLTLWLTNVLLVPHAADAEAGSVCEALRAMAPGVRVVLVSNEVGLGIVPDTALGRQFRDEAGRLNQRVAAIADLVLFVAAGLPLALKSPAR